MGISRVFYRDTLVSVHRMGDVFQLSLTYAGKPTSIGDTLKRWPELSVLRSFFPNDYDSKTYVPPDETVSLRMELDILARDCARFKKVAIEMDDAFLTARFQDTPPEDFCLHHAWQEGALHLGYPPDVAELDSGFYRRGDLYWTLSGLSAMDQVKIRRKTIGKEALLEFLGRDLLAYAAAGIRYQCDINLDTIPVLALTIRDVGRDEVAVHRTWNAPPEHIDADFAMDGYVVAGRTLRPGIRPTDLDALLPFKGDVATLRGAMIPAFLESGYAALKPWVIRGADRFEAAQRFISPPYAWVLAASAETVRGIGRASAHPMALIGRQMFSWVAVLALMQAPYAHLDDGWVRRADLYTLGLNERGTWTGGQRLDPIKLTPAQIVYRGDERLRGIWQRMEMHGAPWCASAVRQDCAREHLRYLAHWGISGGITGGFDACALYGNDLLNELFAGERNLRALVVGCDADLREYERRVSGFQAVPIAAYSGVLPAQVYMARYDEATAAAGVGAWDLMMLIEPDAPSALMDDGRLGALTRVKAALRLCFCVQAPADLDETALRALERLTKLDRGLLALLIQNPRAPVPQPAGYSFEARPIEAARAPEGSEAAGIPGRPGASDSANTADLSGASAYSEAAGIPGGPGASDSVNTADLLSASAYSEAAGALYVLAGEMPAETAIPPREMPDAADLYLRAGRRLIRVLYAIAAARGMALPGLVSRTTAAPGKTDAPGETQPGVGRRSALPHTIVVTRRANGKGEAFLREAQRLAGEAGDERAPHVPFTSYWPTYADMNTAQRRWYFRLRRAMQRGNYPDTDLSYLFIRIYELINLVGCADADDALAQLMDLWTHYRVRHPKLDAYVGDWAFDFLCVNQPAASIAAYLSNAPVLIPEAADLLLMAHDPAEPLILRVPALEALSGYRITQSKFYLAGHGDMLDRALPMAVAWVDDKLKGMALGGLLEQFALQPVAIRRTAYQSAVVAQEATYEITAMPYHACAPLTECLSQMIRYTENLLRGRFGYTGKLRGIALSADIKAWLEAYIARQFDKKPEAVKERRISLDSDMMDKLRSDSDEVRDALIASIAECEIPPEPAAPARPADAPEGLLTDLAPVNRILCGIEAAQQRLLAVLAENGWAMDAGELAHACPGALLEAEIDGINELALRYLGVQLVAREDNLLVVADDYTDEVEYLRSHEAARDTGGWQVDTSGLDAMWLAFFDAADLGVLGALLAGRDALRALAHARHEMPDLLIDDLNAVAADTLGDLIAEGDALSDEYRQMVQEHMRKA